MVHRNLALLYFACICSLHAYSQQASSATYASSNWYPAIVPGTVLNTLVHYGVYPEPYYGDNNRRSRKLIPDITDSGREFYHYWFRNVFTIPKSFAGKRIWLKLHGINYRCVIWCNGKQEDAAKRVLLVVYGWNVRRMVLNL